MKNKFKIFSLFLALPIFLWIFTNKISAQQVMDVYDPNAPQVKYIGHPFTIQPRIYLDSQNIDTLAMRLMHFTPARNTISNVNIHNLFSSQVVLDNTTDNPNGTQRIDIGKVALTPDYTNTAFTPFADITFLAIDTGIGANGVCTSENGWLDCTSTFTLDYNGGPLQSGAFLGGVNYLDSVNSLTVSLQEDSTRPIWSDCTPVAGATNIPVNSDVICNFRDYETGIYLGSTTINIYDSYGFNNITYSNSGADQYNTTAISYGYNIDVNPVQNFPYASIITVFGSGQDNAYNNGPVLDRNTGTFVTSGLADPYTFTTEDDVDAPEIYNRNPDNNQTNVPISTNVNFNIHDIHSTGGYPGLGVDINTLSVTISAPGWGTQVYNISSPELTATVLGTNTPYGNPYDYAISIDPSTDFPQNTWVNVQVTVGDFHAPANVLNTSYSFLTEDTNAPYCYLFRPDPGSTDVLTNDLIIFKCADDGVGIDIDSVDVIVDKIHYTRSGLHSFTYTGSSSEYEITIDPNYEWDQAYAFEVIINLQDFSHNAIEQISYGLATGVGQISCPECVNDCSLCSNTIETVSCEDSNNLTEVPFRSTTVEMDSVNLVLINNKISSQISQISINEEYIELIGTADPNAYVTIMFESTPFILTTIADANGNWNMKIRNVFEIGRHNIYSVARNELTNEITAKRYLASFDITQHNLQVTNILNTHTSYWLWCLCCLIGLILLLIILFLYKKYRGNKNDKKKNNKK